MRYERYKMSNDSASPQSAVLEESRTAARSLGVTIEASYTVGEYDILILSAEDSGGLIKWLKKNDYRLPRGAEKVVDSYLKQDMRFFVAKVNLEEQSKLGYQYLRPLPAQDVFVTRLHVRYDSEHFPEDLVFQETGDRQNYQGRYVISRPWKGEAYPTRPANCASSLAEVDCAGRPREPPHH